MPPPSGETPSVKGADLLIRAYDLITGDRQNDYQHPADDYRKVCDIFRSITGIEMTVEQAILFPLAMKLARMRTNLDQGKWHEDSVVDAMGYLGCLAMIHYEHS